ncbi:Rieske 2Fe-2S domain-containing protein [Paenirhodobacter sp.]|uniref:Rieske 2Fe-2S domain-containing protein n=1 Tax=Paenirhodobacter sp. TaxID=1965326 RepID=UPI003B407177
MPALSPWTPLALSRDLPPGTVAPAHMAGQDLALWRSASGRLSVWSDRCPHRGMRLSQGFVRGEALSCIYHGWRYAEGGQCIRIPAHPDLTPPAAIRVPTFAGVEQDGVIWGAEGTPDTPPPAFAGFTGFRSLQVAAELPACQRLTLAGVDLIVLAQPGGMVHVLAPIGAGDPDRLSAALEIERSLWEEQGVPA